MNLGDLFTALYTLRVACDGEIKYDNNMGNWETFCYQYTCREESSYDDTNQQE